MSQEPASAHNPSTLRGHALAVALLSAGAQFMENVDATIITTGLPAMARDFHTSAVAVNLGITAYLLTLAVFIPVSGWMAARFGERRVFASAILVFTIASAFCGFSRTLPLFTASRVLQGLGGSMMVPVGRLMVVRASSKAQLMKAIAYTIWPALVGPIVGPPIGGLILSVARWPWLFLVNIPIGLVLFLLALRIVRDSSSSRETFDLAGFCWVAVSSTCLISLLEVLQTPGQTLGWSLALVLLCAGSFTGGLRHLRTARGPLFRLELFRIQTFRVATLPGSLFRLAVFSVPFLLPLLFQVGFGLSALASGSLTMAVFAGNLAMKPLTAPVLKRYGFRRVLLVNGAVTVLLLAACGWLSAATPRPITLLVLFAGGLGRSMELTSLTTMGFADLPDRLKGNGTTLATTLQQMTTSVGVATAALILHTAAALRGHADPLDFRIAFCVVAAVAAAALPWFARLHPDAGAAVSGAALRQGNAVSVTEA